MRNDDLNEKFPNLTMVSCEGLGLMHQRGRRIPPPAMPNPGSTSIQCRQPGLENWTWFSGVDIQPFDWWFHSTPQELNPRFDKLAAGACAEQKS
ncbi:hypothetical protein TRIATDRAFT_312299 [Trichoderma atroviride IMI 206040]|uniref:Uncharacterized protein n=1 Tax=Hypocrea atroviridis (strain ATCC 20476 / IMI 206040) TaxID=452589 RepID=G9P8C4_HYPAI|nr:uncharacterized protein TRIATDRAFT_312299 [Trichoderma atroviride IMI 206040]EHK41757.1 hypothetical protein TRIATDRAFT_312299 [Trichoderma atroviride IMI 206040]